jgi:tetratricopeptide (TPR) repeat protein
MSVTRPDTPEEGARWDAVEEATELLHEERYQEAMLFLKRVLEADPRNPYAYHYLGVALYELGELEPARDAYRAAIRLSPDFLGARVHLSHVLRELGVAKGALKEGMDALARFPGDGDLLHAIGLAYHARGDTTAARKYLEAYLRTNPELEAGMEVRALLGTLDPPRED